jgi:hypothetical protein
MILADPDLAIPQASLESCFDLESVQTGVEVVFDRLARLP